MHTLHTVTSADGTTVGYRRLGQGPGVILLHGGMMASQNFMKLGRALSDTFTVFIPDRRGRGSSGPFGNGYSVSKDCDDVRALIEKTAARNVFGLSSGAIIALQAARTVPGIHRVAAYEPPFSVGGSNLVHWAPRFDREIEQGQLAAAMLTVLRGTGDSRFLRLVPDFVAIPLLGLGIRADRKSVKEGDVRIADLIPTMHFDAQIVTETSVSLEMLKEVRSEVLLIGGSTSAAFFSRALDHLVEILPQARRVELAGVGHLAADNGGKPEMVAATLRRFFGRAG
jgi:pimeloyl-ACP methyl ester carboxylesterase